MERMEGIATDMVRSVMAEEGVTQAELAKRMGYRSQSGLSERLGSRGVSVDKVVSMFEKMGYEIIVRKADGTGEKEWKITG